MWGNQVWEDLFTFHSDILWNTLHPTRIPKFSVLSTFPHPYMNLMDFPAVFAGLPIEFAPFLRMASSIASPAMLGRSYASVVQELPKRNRNFGDLTLVKKPGNGQWRWLAQRVLFGAYQVSWDRSWFRWWMMNDGCLFFVGGGVRVRMLGGDDGGEDFRCHLDSDLR